MSARDKRTEVRVLIVKLVELRNRVERRHASGQHAIELCRTVYLRRGQGPKRSDRIRIKSRAQSEGRTRNQSLRGLPVSNPGGSGTNIERVIAANITQRVRELAHRTVAS